MEVNSFAEIEEEFNQRVSSTVWCIFTTVDTRNRPRSRVVHPVWEGTTGWLTTRRNSFKGKHLAQNPYVSVSYYHPAKPVYADCAAEWVDDLAEKQRVWDYIKAIPPLYGFDPAPIYESPDHENFGLIKLIPWRIEVATIPTEKLVWHAPKDS